MEFTIDHIAQLLDGTVEGDGSQLIHTLEKIQEGKPGSIGFLSNLKYEKHLYTTNCSAIIVSEDFVPQKSYSTTLVRVKDPYTAFSKLLESYSELTKPNPQGVEEPSFFGENSVIGEKYYLGAFSYVGKNCIIGDNVKIYPQVYIGDNVTIGNDCVFHSGVKIYAQTKIGNNCEIHAGTILGADGFGFTPQADGTYSNVPQLGNVVLEDNISIGANSTVDCATLGSTIIKKGAKIDNHVQIAHNVTIGENTVIAAQAGVAGSTIIGKNCVLAGKSSIVGHIELANNTTVGGNTGVMKSITEPGTTLFGFIGFDVKAFLKSYSIFKKLPLLQDKLRELEKKQ
ncbi:UDP-3-O-(3-hydroxymyristoyl)glucosamine N-acyltransferase [Cyclobacterium amurskyense]|uniref:UDP-3-O-acylglucosamine N-acyltransferase n=1 Tax=Cyclobacterium amurskyense TaxID=320787 RepID=A0A0H4PBU5_9BACT|nr:UDP-3-O-(3-hydroxymyristoyl)glucosamine N-acyltransferase [Cyclobacterium amurskyense]AKP50283.1 UDP-3-O-acylglucosamine N-acyltransferase [Cyclobacterium amurskyense]|tara:strand:- start:54201 stop:55223 length:1023 start_codon:yes stop_codon:yes gene_type:complete